MGDRSMIDYFFVGPGKTGTSWLYELIERRGIASVPTLKEPHIVDLEPDEAVAAMKSLYDSPHGMCDFSNTYSGDPANPQRIRDHNPDAKVVITTRLPSDRIVSHYWFHVRNGDPDVGVGRFLEQPDNRHVIDRSDYETILARYRAVIPDEQILVLPLEQLNAAPQDYVDRLTAFLGVGAVDLTEVDLEPVLKRAEPRSRRAVRVAMSCSAWLRRRRLSRLLGILKRSSRIKRLMFRQVGGDDEDAVDFGSASAEVQALDMAYPAFVVRESGFVIESA